MRLGPLFHDHAVLQREQPIPVWGTTAPETEVIVRLAGTAARVTAGPDGTWLLRLPPLPAGGPHELVATSAAGEARARDVLIGEVWICSGQSNMEMQLALTPQQVPPAECDLPAIRLLTVGTPARIGRQSVVGGRWALADHASLAGFSAVAGWFGRAVHRALGVPVGLIANAWSGTRIQAWMSRESLMRDPLGIDEVRAYVLPPSPSPKQAATRPWPNGNDRSPPSTPATPAWPPAGRRRRATKRSG